MEVGSNTTHYQTVQAYEHQASSKRGLRLLNHLLASFLLQLRNRTVTWHIPTSSKVTCDTIGVLLHEQNPLAITPGRELNSVHFEKGVVIVRVSQKLGVMRQGTAHQVDRIGILPPVDRHHRRTARALSLPGPRLDHVWTAHFTQSSAPTTPEPRISSTQG